MDKPNPLSLPFPLNSRMCFLCYHEAFVFILIYSCVIFHWVDVTTAIEWQQVAQLFQTEKVKSSLFSSSSTHPFWIVRKIISQHGCCQMIKHNCCQLWGRTDRFRYCWWRCKLVIFLLENNLATFTKCTINAHNWHSSPYSREFILRQ